MISSVVGAHILFTLSAMVLSIVVSLPLGYLGHRLKLGGSALLIAVGLCYAIPSLPMFIIVPAVFGTGLRSPATMIIVLSIYGVALLTRFVADGFASVDSMVIRAAQSQGMTARQRIFSVELPLAMPVIMAGIRVMTVSTVGLVTIGTLVGISNIGSLFTDGFQRGIISEVFLGTVLSVGLALILDAIIVLIAKVFMPWRNA
ncbi:transport system permease [Corynebacterium kutscheri]|uniref:ABC-type proline/glycine betaine transport system, permease component n=1 Tax=Corynebacterium kutscheri TaxID=35755 RepID=A0A0F6R1A9_9CORY|nr:ABC transporter permease subunit [Corynebacterium kutscheri]AKE40898.1 ABC-type proline/glycine betaine transport system, permease component [Corynebacterium kutscheri]VEH06679.1 transport system permease [Corynebacterium kutscheri]VEH09195.1 transport system permease [Corynebacterium kutscheri]VEH79280.1 transport system permease [Corynebacterium kutscheri]